MDAANKRLNAMDRLSDMLHFPAAINAGATANVLLTIAVTYAVLPRFPQSYAPMLWLALVLAVNLLPVVLLRRTLTASTAYPRLGEMNFVRDQHKFSDWVYVAASANMAVWVLGAWALFSVARTPLRLLALLLLAFVVTFAPVLLRLWNRRSRR